MIKDMKTTETGELQRSNGVPVKVHSNDFSVDAEGTLWARNSGSAHHCTEKSKTQHTAVSQIGTNPVAATLPRLYVKEGRRLANGRNLVEALDLQKRAVSLQTSHAELMGSLATARKGVTDFIFNQ